MGLNVDKAKSKTTWILEYKCRREPQRVILILIIDIVQVK